MKKILSLVLMLLACWGSMTAWTPSDTDFRELDAPRTYRQAIMKDAFAPDGSLVHVWLRPVGDVKHWEEGNFYYNLHLQVFDKDGNAKFGDEGIVVCQEPTYSWVSDYGVAIAPNGDILIAYSDIREGFGQLRTRIYRYTLDGTPVWDAQGVRAGTKPSSDSVTWCSELAPALVVNGDNIYLGVWRYDGTSSSDDDEVMNSYPYGATGFPYTFTDTDVHQYQLMRINDDGSMAWDDPVTIPMKYMFSVGSTIAPLGNDGGCVVFHCNDQRQLTARLIDKDGQSVWPQDVLMDANIITTSTNDPARILNIFPDGDGGLLLAYLHARTGEDVLNHVTADGTVLANPLLIKRDKNGYGSTIVKGDIVGDSLMLAFDWLVNGRASDLLNVNHTMQVNLFDTEAFEPAYAWPTTPIDIQDGVTIGVADAHRDYTPLAVKQITDGWVIIYSEAIMAATKNYYVTKVSSATGEVLWGKRIAEREAMFEDVNVICDDQYAYVFATNLKDYYEPSGMRVYCIDLTDQGNPSAVTDVKTIEQTGTETRYDLSGRVVTADYKGLQIVKHADGSVEKVLVK